MSEPIVSLVNVVKAFGENVVVKNLNLTIEQGEFLTLLGPSGCEKTTTLRMIAGFETASSGIISINGDRIEDKEPFERNVNTVFQNYALFPHMTVAQNVAYGLNLKKVPKEEIKKRVKEMLKLVQLEGFENRKPGQMSGGQKQRVAIARALINRPQVLLLDEPLGALDLKLRKQMQVELKRLQRKLKITFVYVTHDQEEAMTMSDRIAIMHNGELEQVGTPTEIYEHPKTKFVAGFIGESNIFDCTVEKIENDLILAKTENGSLTTEGEDFQAGDFMYASIRPEDTKYSKTPVDGFRLTGIVKDVIYIGQTIKTLIQMPNGSEVKIVRLENDKDIKEGDKVYIYWEPGDSVSIRHRHDSILKAINSNNIESLVKKQQKMAKA